MPHPVATCTSEERCARNLHFRLYSDGTFRVFCTSAKYPETTLDEGCATMGEVHAEDAETYFDAWLEELRCLLMEED